MHITNNVYNGYGYRLLDLLSSNTGEALRFLTFASTTVFQDMKSTECLPRPLLWWRVVISIPSATTVIQSINVSGEPISILILVLISRACRNVRRQG